MKSETKCTWYALLDLKDAALELGEPRAAILADKMLAGLKGNTGTRFRVTIEELPDEEGSDV